MFGPHIHLLAMPARNKPGIHNCDARICILSLIWTPPLREFYCNEAFSTQTVIRRMDNSKIICLYVNDNMIMAIGKLQKWFVSSTYKVLQKQMWLHNIIGFLIEIWNGKDNSQNNGYKTSKKTFRHITNTDISLFFNLIFDDLSSTMILIVLLKIWPHFGIQTIRRILYRKKWYSCHPSGLR